MLGEERAPAGAYGRGGNDRRWEEHADDRTDHGAFSPAMMGMALDNHGFTVTVLDQGCVGDRYHFGLNCRLQSPPVGLRRLSLFVNGDSGVEVRHS